MCFYTQRCVHACRAAMSTNPLHAMWSSAAPSWGEHADFVDERGAVVGQAMLAAADIRPGDDVLELGCGPGGVGFSAAEVVGADGQVVLSDVAPEMTAIAAERAARRGLRNVVIRELDMEHLDLPDASYDKVLCREALMLVADPTAAAREALRVLRPPGRAVFAVWGKHAANPWLSALLDADSVLSGSVTTALRPVERQFPAFERASPRGNIAQTEQPNADRQRDARGQRRHSSCARVPAPSR